MDNGQGNPGSFMSMVGGGGDLIKQALERRGMSGGPLNQNTTSPNAVPPSQAANMSSPTPSMSGGMSSLEGMTPPVGGNPEAQLILKAQDSYLKSLAKIAEAQAGVR